MQVRGVGQHVAPVGAVARRRTSTRSGREPVGVHDAGGRRAGGPAGPGCPMAAPTRRSASPAWRRCAKLAAEFCPASNTTVISRPAPARHVGGVSLRAAGGVPGDQLVDHGGELGDVGPVTGVGVGDQRDAAVAGDHQAEPDQAQVGRFCLALPRGAIGACRCRCRCRWRSWSCPAPARRYPARSRRPRGASRCSISASCSS